MKWTTLKKEKIKQERIQEKELSDLIDTAVETIPIEDANRYVCLEYIFYAPKSECVETVTRDNNNSTLYESSNEAIAPIRFLPIEMEKGEQYLLNIFIPKETLRVFGFTREQFTELTATSVMYKNRQGSDAKEQATPSIYTEIHVYGNRGHVYEHMKLREGHIGEDGKYSIQKIPTQKPEGA